MCFQPISTWGTWPLTAWFHSIVYNNYSPSFSLFAKNVMALDNQEHDPMSDKYSPKMIFCSRKYRLSSGRCWQTPRTHSLLWSHSSQTTWPFLHPENDVSFSKHFGLEKKSLHETERLLLLHLECEASPEILSIINRVHINRAQIPRVPKIILSLYTHYLNII